METYETKEYKQAVIDKLTSIDFDSEDLSTIEPRLDEYCRSVQAYPEGHNIYELLSVIRFVRLRHNYFFANEPVQRIIGLLERVLRFTTMEGQRSITLSPCQVFQFTSIYGFYFQHEDGDYRRLCRKAIIFIPRKYGKTTQTVGIAANDMLFGDHNGQVYILSNTDKQALVCFGEVKAVMKDADTDNMMKFTAHKARWREGAFKADDPNKMATFIESLSGTPKGKDGPNASTIIYDEYGSAFYVKDHSDGAALLQVMESSMGMRKEPLTVIITTASRHLNTPFKPRLEAAQKILRDELESDGGKMEDDDQFAHIFCPDAWEMDDASICQPSVWAKVQPHLGYTVQADYYKRAWREAMKDPEAYVEFKTKLLNIFQEVAKVDWLTAEDIRKRSGHRRIDDISLEDGWECYVGMDFSKGNDLNAQAYFCHRVVTDEEGHERDEFFVDCDAWITEEIYNSATLNPLYKEWVEAGFLRISPNAVIDENLILRRIQEISHHVNIVQFGYDRYDADRFVNAINAWLYGLGLEPSKYMKVISQSFGNFNAPVQGFEYLVKVEPSIIEFSNNPLISWCVGNCVLEEDKTFGNVKPVKRTLNQKIDVAICMLEGLIMYNEDDANKILLN